MKYPRRPVSGHRAGQINGLAVIQTGNLMYGFPARISATIGAGTAGVVNIEDRAAMSGAIHTKDLQIHGGLIRHMQCHRTNGGSRRYYSSIA